MRSTVPHRYRKNMEKCKEWRTLWDMPIEKNPTKNG
jgi:hypothetical protein